MHPWTKAYYDVSSKDDLDALYAIEAQMFSEVQSFQVDPNIVFSEDEVTQLKLIGFTVEPANKDI